MSISKVKGQCSPSPTEFMSSIFVVLKFNCACKPLVLISVSFAYQFAVQLSLVHSPVPLSSPSPPLSSPSPPHIHTHSLPLLLPPYLYSMHNSPVKCVEVYSNVTKEVWQTISKVGKVQQEAIYRAPSKVSTRDCCQEDYSCVVVSNLSEITETESVVHK